ncbi:myotubularin-related protein 4 isoform X5 [Sitodiplosis mosellana]|uniref:myotubularin-related protein 4 isoform X5 n=1 Tax=Sitodiplosis mosellana TaxID=263140 RepID=UPI002443E4C9|nr:myotubularin-related protein 4 isoform X5 [Sitodiplosis mosellana]
MEGDGSPLSSLCMVRAAELFPKPEPQKEDESLKVPFTELAGEYVRYIGRTDDGVLALSNYRICLKSPQTSAPDTEISIPLGVIEYVSVRDLFQLVVSCKDASTFRCTFPTSEQASEWQRRITLAVGVPTSLETLFAFSYYAWASEQPSNADNEWLGRMQRANNYDEDFRREVRRLEFNTSTSWRISTINIDFKLCPSYPRLLLVPMCITDEILTNVASFRSARRIPAVVWRHKASGAVVGRCSQPEVGWLGWRNPKDEQLLKAIADACAFDGGELGRRQGSNNNANASETSSTDGSHEEMCMDEVKKILIVDARSYASAVTNRARGGGCECAEYYPCAAIEFMNLGNIHVIRKSFHALRALAASPTDSQSWFTALDRTMWLSHLAGLMQSAMRICHAVEREGRSAIVHCSDGWDRTPQLVSTALLCLDPYYRTVDGFRVLVEREWLSFGHKFADRIGHGPGSDETNERCPVFLQWLDCVHQIQKQFPCSFEFSMAYLIKLAQHVFSCMFGTFLCNTYKERIENSVFDRTYSVWPFLSGPMYKNPLYIPNREQVLWPAYHPSNLSYWAEVYSSSFGNQNQSDSSMTTSISPSSVPVAVATASVGTSIVTPSTNDISNSEPRSPMIKTRSYGDLQTAGCNGISNGMIRRSSDPNMTADAHFNMNLSTEPSIETLPEFYANGANVVDTNVINDQTIANFCSDTVRELNNLTEDLIQQTDLGEIGGGGSRVRDTTNHNMNQINSSFNSSRFMETALSSRKSVHDDAIASVQSPEDSQSNAHSSIADHNYAIPYHNSTPITDQLCCTETEIGNLNCDVVDSSPFYTHFNKHLENNMGDDGRVSANSLQHNKDERCESVNGRVSSEGSRDEDYRVAMCMLQSVDLRDTSPLSSSPMAAQSQWHGNIETSTDTLVPVDTLSSELAEEQIRCELSTAVITSHSKESAPSENGMGLYGDSDRSRPRILPEVHTKSKALPNDNALDAMDESILIQPEQQRMEILNGNRSDSNQLMSATAPVPNGNGNGIVTTMPLYRRRRNSNNSKPPPCIADMTTTSNVRSDSISPNTMNSKFVLPNNTTSRSVTTAQPTSIRTINTPSQTTNISMISCPDGLAHALSEQNLRLQQIVHEHKIREEALQKELQALRLALLRKRSCSNCSNGQTNNGTTSNVVDETDDDDESLVAQSDYSGSVRSRQSSEGPSTALLPKTYSWASSKSANSMVDNGVENVSICSWEAVDERSGPLSGASSTNAISSSVLWVPDHAVKICTSCQTEFWLGRRKHHCRSCGQIFCADCSEYWAALPDERLFTPVRLCGPCYHTITKSQVSFHIRSSDICSNADSGRIM